MTASATRRVRCWLPQALSRSSRLAAATDDYPIAAGAGRHSVRAGRHQRRPAARIVATQLSERLGKQFIDGIQARRRRHGGHRIRVSRGARRLHHRGDLGRQRRASGALQSDLRSAQDVRAGGDARCRARTRSRCIRRAGQHAEASSSRSPSRSRATSSMRRPASAARCILAWSCSGCRPVFEMLHVPFRGAGPAAIDVVAGNTKAVMSSTSTLSPHVRAGKLRGIGISSRARLPSMPEVPTFIEAGFPQYEAGNWIGFAVPAGTPKPIVEKLQKEIAAILDMPDVAEAVREPRRDRREDDGRRVRRLYRRRAGQVGQGGPGRQGQGGVM